MDHVSEAATSEFGSEQDVFQAEVAEDEVEELGGVEDLRGYWCGVARAHEDGIACCAWSDWGGGGGHITVGCALGGGCCHCVMDQWEVGVAAFWWRISQWRRDDSGGGRRTAERKSVRSHNPRDKTQQLCLHSSFLSQSGHQHRFR